MGYGPVARYGPAGREIQTEKSHDGHLPERNYRGTAGAIVTSGIPGGLLIIFSVLSGTGSIRKETTAPHVRRPDSSNWFALPRPPTQ